MATEYVKNVFVKQGRFGTKVSFKVDAFIEELKAKKNSQGYVNIEIKTSQSGDKMYATYDNWEPTSRGGAPASKQPYTSTPKVQANKGDDGLPF